MPKLVVYKPTQKFKLIMSIYVETKINLTSFEQKLRKSLTGDFFRYSRGEI